MNFSITMRSPLQHTLFAHWTDGTWGCKGKKNPKCCGLYCCQEHGINWVVCFVNCWKLGSDWEVDIAGVVLAYFGLQLNHKANQKYWTAIFHVIKQEKIVRYCIIHHWLERFGHNWNYLFFYCCSASVWSQGYVLNCLTGRIVWQDGLYFFEV